jgi:hypothetical protein
MKGSVKKKEIFGRSGLQGMHTWDDASSIRATSATACHRGRRPIVLELLMRTGARRRRPLALALPCAYIGPGGFAFLSSFLVLF